MKYFLCFFLKTAEYLSPKLAIVFWKLARDDSFCECWRISNLLLYVNVHLVFFFSAGAYELIAYILLVRVVAWVN